MWRLNDPQGNEAAKIKYQIVPFTRGRGLDLGCGPYKAYPHFIGVDNGHHWGTEGADVAVDTCEDLSMFTDESMDFVFSSHLLEHIEDTKGALEEWWRVIKVGGHLVLYLPDDKLYPKVGEPGANPDHKHNLNQDMIRTIMGRLGGWDLVKDELRDQDFGEGSQGNEYSFFQVYRKRDDKIRNNVASEPKPEKTALVVRYGGFGDMIQASSILPWMKEEGYHITFATTPNGYETIKHDPHIDNFILQDKDQVPNAELSLYLNTISHDYDVMINLCESVERSLLYTHDRIQFSWPKHWRHQMANINYLDMTHGIATVPLPPRAAFYPTEEEKLWAKDVKEKLGGNKVIMWVIRGSSVHKFTHYMDQVVAKILYEHPEARIVTVGDKMSQFFEAGWEKEDRVMTTAGNWTIRQTLAFAMACDCVVGPETGVMNAVGMERDIAKVCLLSHSSAHNLAKYWDNAVTIAPSDDVECYPCHQMHYDWNTCNEFHYSKEFCDKHNISTVGGLLEEGVKVSKCMAHIFPDDIYDAIKEMIFKSNVIPMRQSDGHK